MSGVKSETLRHAAVVGSPTKKNENERKKTDYYFTRSEIPEDLRNVATIQSFPLYSWTAGTVTPLREQKHFDEAHLKKQQSSQPMLQDKPQLGSAESRGIIEAPLDDLADLVIESVPSGTTTAAAIEQHGSPTNLAELFERFSDRRQSTTPTSPLQEVSTHRRRDSFSGPEHDLQKKTSAPFRNMMATNDHFALVSNLAQIKVGDVLIVAPEPESGPRVYHGFIAIITCTEPLLATMLELAIPERKRLGSQAEERVANIPGQLVSIAKENGDIEYRQPGFAVRRDVLLAEDYPLDRRSRNSQFHIANEEHGKSTLTMLNDDISKGYVFKLNSEDSETQRIEKIFRDYAFEVSEMHPAAIHRSFNCNSGIYYTVIRYLETRQRLETLDPNDARQYMDNVEE